MLRLLRLVPACLCLIAVPGIAAEFRADLPSYFAPRAEQAPVLDGDLGDACWGRAPEAGGFILFPSREPAPDPTRFQVVWDEQALYIAVTAGGDYARGPVVGSPERDSQVWDGDSIELFLDPDRTEARYFHLAVNADNTQADESIPEGGMAWNGQWRSAARVSADRYAIEVAIPWTTLGADAPDAASVWGLGVDRNEPVGDRMRFSGWSPGAEGFHAPHVNGYLLFGSTRQHLLAMADRVEAELQPKLAQVSEHDLKVAPATAAEKIAAVRRTVETIRARAGQEGELPVSEWAPLARQLASLGAELEAAVWTIRLWGLLLGE